MLERDAGTHTQRKQDNTERIKVKIIFVFY